MTQTLWVDLFFAAYFVLFFGAVVGLGIWKVKRRRVDAFAPSLLAKAFRGELVPQGPNDEPASVLLEQIEMQRKNTHESRLRKRL